MALTQFSTDQYKDKSVTSAKLEDNISIRGTLDVDGQINSHVPSGTAPFTVTSNTEVVNLNAGLLGGHDDTYFATSDELNSTVVNSQTLTFGANTIQHTGKVPVFPAIKFHGMHYVNLPGKDGDCEDINKWQYAGAGTAIELSTAQKMFGSKSILVTTQITTGGGGVQTNAGNLYPIVNTKYYFASVYVYNVSMPSIALYLMNSSNTTMVSSVVTSVTGQWVRIGVKLPAVEIDDTSCGLYIRATPNTAGQQMYVDGAMLTEISMVDNNLTVDQLLAKYPYVESYGCLTNPYFENRRYNLVRNGNCEEGIAWWTPDNSVNSLSIVDSKLRVATTGSYGGIYQLVPVKANTNYYIKSTKTAGTSTPTLNVWSSLVAGTLLASDNGSFNSGISTLLCISMYVNGTGYADFDSIMLVEGTTAPAEYISCDLQQFVIEGQFTSDDEVEISDGKLSGQLWWKHGTLYGKDYGWTYYADWSGFKQVRCTNPLGINTSATNHTLIKYDGKPTPLGATNASADKFLPYTDGNLYISISDSDSGWIEAVNPNNDEVKAYMNGWKAIWNNGTRYILWQSIVDSTLPAGGVLTTLSVTVNTQTSTISVVDASRYVIGDTLAVICNNGAFNAGVIQDISGNDITFTNALNFNVAAANIGNSVIRCDNGTTNISLLTWCKNNIAPNYEGYQLHYKLSNPEPITDMNTHIHGDIWSIAPGDNYINVDSGIVLGEVANTMFNAATGSTAYVINDGYSAYIPSLFHNFSEDIRNIYKNKISDIANWTITVNDAQYLGDKYKLYGYIAKAIFDINATYTVDYQILKTRHVQSFGSLTISYAQGVYEGVESIAKAVESKEVSAQEILEKIKTVDGEDSGLDADKLGGKHLNEIYSKNSGDLSFKLPNPPSAISLDQYIASLRAEVLYFTGNKNTNSNIVGIPSDIGTDYMVTVMGGNTYATFYYATITIESMTSGHVKYFGQLYNNNTFTGWKKIWNEATDGHGSGLIADKLDDIESTGFGRAYSSTHQFGTGVAMTTAEFITMLTGLGAFAQPYWMARGSWSYAGNNYISDTGLGHIHLAGATVEVMGTATTHTICIHTATTSSIAGAAVSSDFIYLNNGPTYSPGWRKLWSSSTDGHGSGLVADKLDDKEASDFFANGSATVGVDPNAAPDGVSYISNNANCPSFFPEDHSGTLYQKTYSVNWITQFAVAFHSTDIAVRAKMNGTWSAWSKAVTLPQNTFSIQYNATDDSLDFIYG